MNYLSIFLISTLTISFVLYFFLTRRAFKRLTATLISFQLAGQKLQEEHRLLMDQYRQLANINAALRGFTNYKKK